MHIMAYDQNGRHHSTYEYGVSVLDQGMTLGLPRQKLTLGVPFYGRNSQTGDWTTYEDLVQQYHPLNETLDEIPVKSQGKQKKRLQKKDKIMISFNGKETIRRKTEYALNSGAGGVMIWEVGQDCRVKAVTRWEQTHQVTCPDGEDSSLLMTMKKTINQQNQVKDEL
jgi:chitinase